MKLPNANHPRVDKGKVVDYLLSASHPDGRSKAAFFLGFGFTPRHWRTLADALCDHGMANEVTKTDASEFGARYCIDGPIETPDGRNPHVRTVWIIEDADERPRLVTAHPIRRQEYA